MYAARKSGLKKEMFGYMAGGYEKINKHFAEHLIKLGVTIQYNTKVSTVEKKGDKLLKIVAENNTQIFDIVISTLSSQASVTIANELTDEEKQKHNSIKYLGVICPSVLLRKAISPYYVTNITDSWPPFTGVIEMTALIDKKEVNGNHLVYLPKYVNPDDALFDMDDAAIRKYFLDALFKMYPQITEADILFWGTSKARIVFALPTINYSKNIPGIATSIDNYYIVNSAQIINGTLNVNETILVAENKLKEILNKND
jgi:protoporphyrinogen oxidase